MTIGTPTMLRRTLMTMIPIGLAGACTSHPTDLLLRAGPDAPPVIKIERLLLWIPSDAAAQVKPGLFTKTLFSFTAFADALKARLSPRGVAVEVGTLDPLELDRREAQRAVVARFKPTHRLEIQVDRAVAGNVSYILLSGALYNAADAKPVRTFRWGTTGGGAAELAELLVAKLQAENFL